MNFYGFILVWDDDDDNNDRVALLVHIVLWKWIATNLYRRYMNEKEKRMYFNLSTLQGESDFKFFPKKQ